MKNGHSREFGGILRGLAAFGGLFLASCGLLDLFSDTSVTVDPGAYPSAESIRLDSVTGAPATVVVAMFDPYLDARLAPGGETALLTKSPVRIREHGTGRVVEYRYSRRGYGSWSTERERQLNLLLLRGFFLKPGVFDGDSGITSVDSLYARAALHDAHTRYVDSAEAEEYRRASRTTSRPRVLGIQIRVNDAEDTVYLELVAPGSPAYKAGLRRGMPLLAVNDSAVTGDSAAARFLRFIAADTLATTLTVGTAQGPRTETVVRDTVSFPTVLADSLGGAGYVAVFSFTQSTVNGGSTYDEFRTALAATRGFPATVLDLRGNGGGSLGVTLRMCDEVLSGGVIIRLVERGLDDDGASVRIETTYRALPGDGNEGRAFVILADGGTASASELLIAALRENLGSPLMGGSNTYGKGVGQISFDTPGGGVAIVTYGSALTASGVDYNGTGFTPTHFSGAKPDAMLAQAAELAVPGALARRSADGRQGTPGKARLIDWNRRQALRPDVMEWGEGKAEIRNQK